MSIIDQLPFTDGGIAIAVISNMLGDVVLLFCFGLNLTVHQFCVNDFTQQCYVYSKGVNPLLRTWLYYLLMSLSCIVFMFVSVLMEPNLAGIEVSFEADTFNLLIVFGYVVYSQESRQTSLEGFLIIRDCLLYGGTIALLAYCLSSNSIPPFLWAIPPFIFMVFWLLNCFNSSLQYRIMKLLNLLQDERVVSPELLLTQQPAKVDINELQDIITDNTPRINEQINKFKQLLLRAIPNDRQRKIHQNFASIVLTFKTAIEIKKRTEAKDRSAIYQRFWVPKEDDYFGGPQVHTAKPEEEDEQLVSMGEQLVAEDKTEQEEQPIEEGLVLKVLRYIYYPIYLLSIPKGRLKYICYLIGLVLMVASIVAIHLCCCYLGSRAVDYKIIVLIASQLLAMPKLVYFLRLPGHSDYDFCNIFLQMGIVKACIVVPLCIVLSIFAMQNQLDTSGISRYLIVKGGTLLLFMIVLCAKRIVARRDNFKYFAVLYAMSFIACVLVQIL